MSLGGVAVLPIIDHGLDSFDVISRYGVGWGKCELGFVHRDELDAQALWLLLLPCAFAVFHVDEHYGHETGAEG